MPSLTIHRGDSWDETFEVLNGQDYMNLGVVALARFTIKNNKDDLDSEALIRLSTGVGGVTILTQDEAPPAGTLGCLRVDLTPADTRSLVSADYQAYWDLQLTLTNGKVYTPLRGEVTIEGDVTHNSGDVGTDT